MQKQQRVHKNLSIGTHFDMYLLLSLTILLSHRLPLEDNLRCAGIHPLQDGAGRFRLVAFASVLTVADFAVLEQLGCTVQPGGSFHHTHDLFGQLF